MFKNIFKKSKDLLSVDIGSKKIKILHMNYIDNTYLIDDIFIIENPFDLTNPDSYLDILGEIRALLKEKEIHTKKIRISISDNKLYESIIKLDAYEEKEFKTIIESEYIKNFSMIQEFNTYRFDYERLGKSTLKGRNSEYVLLGAILKLHSEKLLEACKKRGFYLDRISTEVSALNNLIKINEGSYTGIQLHLGNKGTSLFLCKDNVVIFNRKIEFGYENLIRVLQKEMDCPREILVKNIRENGVGKEDLPKLLEDYGYEGILDIVLLKFLNELYDSINYIKTTYGITVEEIQLSGGFSELKGIDKSIKEYLKVNVINFKENLNKERISIQCDKDFSSDLIIALGLGIGEEKNEKNKFITRR